MSLSATSVTVRLAAPDVKGVPLSEQVDCEQVADVLEAAADYIETNGHHQGDARGPCARTDLPSKCVVAAVTDAAVSIARPASLIVRTINAALNAVRTEVGMYSVEWSETPGREEWEITEGLRSTAKRVRHGDIPL